MALTELYTGTEAVGTTEHSMTTDTAGPDTDTTAGVFVAVIDIDDVIDGDSAVFTVYEKSRTGDTQRPVDERWFINNQGSQTWHSPAYALTNGWDMTLRCPAGTVTFNWSIRRVN